MGSLFAECEFSKLAHLIDYRSEKGGTERRKSTMYEDGELKPYQLANISLSTESACDAVLASIFPRRLTKRSLSTVRIWSSTI